jgi:hypothetical protein
VARQVDDQLQIGNVEVSGATTQIGVVQVHTVLTIKAKKAVRSMVDKRSYKPEQVG